MDTATILLFLFFLLFTFHLTTSLSKDLCHRDDKNTLLKIKKSLNNPYNLNTWDPKSDCCSWELVTCDTTANNRIIYLEISDNHVSTYIPSEVGDLLSLQSLIFYKLSNLNGQIPPTIAKLKYLRVFYINWTNLTGPVPEFLSELKNLEFLNLSYNNLSGSIPSSLPLLPKLGYIDLSRNKLTGAIPETFGSLRGEFPRIYLSHNQLSGSLPKSLGNVDLYQIDFSRNKLQGDASMLFGANKTTWFIDISRNMFQFDISKVNITKKLNHLDLNHNRITGSIPVQWTTNVFNIFNVSYNRLCGPIPRGGSLQSFDSYSYFHNKCLCDAPLQSCK